jgi:hypothetical protein
MVDNLKISKNEISVVVLPSSSYKAKEMEVVKQLSTKFKAVCYVNVSRSFTSLCKELKKNSISESNFLFIDAITKKAGKEHKNCIYLNSPHALTNLSVTIKKALQTNKFDAFLFDSLSSLVVYHKVPTLTRFIHDLFAAVKKKGMAAVFTLQEGTNKELMADIGMFADQVIEVKQK